MTNYNLTFNEAIAAGEAGNLVCNDSLEDKIFRYEDGKWFHRSESEKYPQDWYLTDFWEREINAKWRIVQKQELSEDSEKDAYHIMRESRISALEEKVANFKIYIDDLYELINGDEDIFTSYNQRLDEFEKRLEERHEEWGDGAYSAIVKSMNHVLWENLSIEKRLEVLESTFLMKIDFDERLTKLEEKIKILISCNFKEYCDAYVDNMDIDEELKDRLEAALKINDKDSYGGTE